MARITGIRSTDFTQLDNSTIFSTSLLYTASGNSATFSVSGTALRFLGDFTAAYGNEDSITRVEIENGTGIVAVIDNVGLTDMRIYDNLSRATQKDLLEFVLRGDDEFNMSGDDDTVDGFDGNDEIRAGGGNDSVNGSAGEDTLRGGTGNDTLLGGSGNDSIVGQSDVDTLNGGSGEDTLKGGGGGDRLIGGLEADFLKGGTDDDFLVGGDDDDILAGNAGSDILVAGRGADFLNGGGENDELFDGRGPDTLKGGAGSDRFVFINNHGHDVILDFDATDDNEFIDFSLNDDMNSFSDVQAVTSQVGNDVLIQTSSSSSILLKNVDVVDLDANDFSF